MKYYCFQLSKCRVVPDILATTKDIVCAYRDIIYDSDKSYHLGTPTYVQNDDVYVLTRSDHVKIKCVGTHINRYDWL